MTILDKIVENKRQEVALLKKTVPLESLLEKENYRRDCLSMKSRLQMSSTGIISEFKRKSPSKGFIKEFAEVSVIVPGYEKAGATGVSILADNCFFAGRAEDVSVARPLVNLPILFKEFVVDEYQLHQAKAAGADVVLLIAAALSESQCRRLAEVAKSIGLEVLLELHDATELSFVHPEVDLVGINNRNLKTFEVDVEASVNLCHRIPDYCLKISESGISSPDMVRHLREEGFSGFLMGEAFMKEVDPPAALSRFIENVLNN